MNNERVVGKMMREIKRNRTNKIKGKILRRIDDARIRIILCNKVSWICLA